MTSDDDNPPHSRRPRDHALREIENEIADLRAEQQRLAARLALLEARRRDALDRANRVSSLRERRPDRSRL